jgi:hypothetical protein
MAILPVIGDLYPSTIPLTTKRQHTDNGIRRLGRLLQKFGKKEMGWGLVVVIGLDGGLLGACLGVNLLAHGWILDEAWEILLVYFYTRSVL